MKGTSKYKITRAPLFKLTVAVLITLLVILALIVAFISPITKYVVEKYDEKWTGRQITMDWAYVNPFTGFIYFHNFKAYEANSESVFLAADGVSIRLDMTKIFSQQYDIKKLKFTKFYGKIVQLRGKQVNYGDIIDHFSSKDSTDTIPSKVKVRLLNVKITDGVLHYFDETIPVNYFVRKLELESQGMQNNADSIEAKFTFLSGPSTGDIKANINLNLENLNYRYNLVVNKFDLQIMDQYLRDISNYGSLRANLDADIKAKGNFHDELDLHSEGVIAINDLHFGTPGKDYFAFDKLLLDMDEVAPNQNIYLLDSVILTHPYMVFEQYDYLNSLERMFGPEGANITATKEDPSRFNLIIEIGNFIKVITMNFFNSYYKVDKAAIYNADVKYRDYTPREIFSIDANPLTVITDSVDKNNSRVTISFNSGIEPYGNAVISFNVNPKHNGDYDMTYHVQNIPVALFNPYLITYTSFPLDRGSLEIKGEWNVRNGEINSNNHFLVIDPRVTKRIRKKDTKWIPMPLVMALIRERGNVIDYEIPITGNLKNPKFHLHDVLMDLLTNIFVKPPTTPYRLEVRNLENEIEKDQMLKWEMRQTILHPKQEKFINKIADFLEQNSDARIAVSPFHYADKEKEYILYYEAKKKYYLLANHINPKEYTSDDSDKVEKMSIKDSTFIKFLDKHNRDSMLFTVQQKCRYFIGEKIIESQFSQLVKKRESAFLHYFAENRTEKRVQMNSNKNGIPYNGFSYFKIKYKGEIPESLAAAYQKLNELNEEGPRKKYLKERKKILGFL